MLEIIGLIYLTRKMGALALQKGLNPGKWKVYSVLTWFGAEFMGFVVGIILFGSGNMIGIILFALMCAIGSALYIHALLKKKPDNMEDDINNIGM